VTMTPPGAAFPRRSCPNRRRPAPAASWRNRAHADARSVRKAPGRRTDPGPVEDLRRPPGERASLLFRPRPLSQDRPPGRGTSEEEPRPAQHGAPPSPFRSRPALSSGTRKRPRHPNGVCARAARPQRSGLGRGRQGGPPGGRATSVTRLTQLQQLSPDWHQDPDASTSSDLYGSRPSRRLDRRTT
jgi:hypothetical protein